MKMKGIDIFCASQASTAICMNMDHQASSSVVQLGGRALDRHNPIIQDARRSTSSRTLPIAPCSSQSPINPKAYHQLPKNKKKATSSSLRPSTKSSSKENDQKRKSTSNIFHGKLDENVKKFSSVLSESVVRKSSANPIDLITPPGSSRSLLSDTVIFDGLSDYDPVLALVPVGQKKNAVKIITENKSTTSSIGSSSSSLTKDKKTTNATATATAFQPGCCIDGVPSLQRVCRKTEKTSIQNGRGDIIQHRLRSKEGDSHWRCNPIECPCQCLKGEERSVLAYCVISITCLSTLSYQTRGQEII